MALVVKDRVRETSTTTGTGTLTLAGAVSGFQTFSSAIGNTNTTYYTIINGTEWETGLGTVAAGTLARTTVLESSNAGAAVSFTAGTKDVFGTYPASKALYKDASGNAIGLGTVAATTTLTSATGLPLSTGVTGTLPIANGGTGTTTLASATIATQGYTTTATAAGTTTLTVSSTQLQFFTGTTTQTVVLPVASTLTSGQRFEINNNSTGSVTVNSSGANLVSTVSANTTVVCTCILTSGTTAASWDVDVQGFTTSLPAALGGTGLTAVGSSGNLLTSNGTTWTSSTPATPNTAGGATTVSQGTSLTLTSASNRVQVVTFTADSLSVILPDATTLSAGGPTFIITNNGTYTFSIKLNGGVVLTLLASGQSVMCELYDNTTASGLWLTSATGIASVGSVGIFGASTIDSTNAALLYTGNGNGTAGHFVDCLKLTSTTALLVWTRNGNTSVYGVVATNTAGTLSFGTIVQIYNGSAGGTAAVVTAAAMLLSGLTTGMVFIGRSATAVAVPFSISGTTITVGTVSANFGDAATYNNVFHSAVAMSATEMMIVYNDSTYTEIRVATMTYNGASAPTLGTPTAGIAVKGYGNVAPNGVLLKLTSTTAQLWYTTTTHNWTTRVVTSNGASAPTLGTAITATVSASQGMYGNPPMGQPYAYSATETSIVCTPNVDSFPTVASYTISGTTVTQTSAPVAMVNTATIGLCSRIEWVTSTTGIFYQTSVYGDWSRYGSLSKIYKIQYTPSGGTILYSGVGTLPDSTVYTYLAGMCLLSSTTGIVAGYKTGTGYISASAFIVN